jgi:hypothetical protein
MRTGHAIASGVAVLFTLSQAKAEEAAPASAPIQSVAQPAAQPAPQSQVMWAPPPARPEQTKRNSTGMMITGIVLTSLSAVSLTAGAAVIVGDTTDGDGTAIAAVLIGGPLVIGGAVFSAVGIPLWVIGSRQVPVRPGYEEAHALPQLFVGPKSASLRWTF